MKKLLIAALLVASTAYADTVGTLRNRAGGLIVLTDVPSDNCRTFAGVAYSTTNNNRTMWGCWFSDDLMVHILWDDGESRAYPIDNFNINESVARRLRNRLKGDGRTL